jgi:N-acetylglucosaminyldiphosphoundecaprenol N-acetyl-beta-D-mannosaminyltransferase
MASQEVWDSRTDDALSCGAVQLPDRATPSADTSEAWSHADNLAREVYGILGIPIDVLDMPTVLRKIAAAAAQTAPFLISTANLHFLVTSLNDSEFRESLLLSDICTPDGMPIVWIGRILGIPIKHRIAGSDIFDALKSFDCRDPLRVFLFGGAPNVAIEAGKKINAAAGGLKCVGMFDPGFTSVDQMSTHPVINVVNATEADFLAVALGAEKGQAWLQRNHFSLRAPVRAHLGAAINYQAGTLRRAPDSIQRLGLEWLWRIAQEPQLWRRYWRDGGTLIGLLITRILPLVVLAKWHALQCRGHQQRLSIERTDDGSSVYLHLIGYATADHISTAASSFRTAVTASKDVVINFARTELIDCRFLGLLVMLKKQLTNQGLATNQCLRLAFTDVPPRIERLFRLNGFGFLVSTKSRA